MPPVAFPRRISLCSLLFTILFTCLLGSVTPAQGQRDFTRIYGAQDQEIPTPAFTGTLGQKDAAALQELIDYVKAVNITTWKGLQASGILTDAFGNASHASLAIQNGDHFRLDVETPKGQRSTRISGSYGKTLEANGKSFFMPPETARTGLFAFPQLLDSTFPRPNTSFIDRGQIQIGGELLHRITVEEPVFSDEAVIDHSSISVTDLYFDSSTHLLLKSASSVQLESQDRERYLTVITYGDYQKVQDSLILFQFSQTLNGQSQWTLQLNQPNLQPSVDTSYFQF